MIRFYNRISANFTRGELEQCKKIINAFLLSNVGPVQYSVRT